VGSSVPARQAPGAAKGGPGRLRTPLAGKQALSDRPKFVGLHPDRAVRIGVHVAARAATGSRLALRARGRQPARGAGAIERTRLARARVRIRARAHPPLLGCPPAQAPRVVKSGNCAGAARRTGARNCMMKDNPCRHRVVPKSSQPAPADPYDTKYQLLHARAPPTVRGGEGGARRRVSAHLDHRLAHGVGIGHASSQKTRPRPLRAPALAASARAPAILAPVFRAKSGPVKSTSEHALRA
jgi:hypothetical protein